METYQKITVSGIISLIAGFAIMVMGDLHYIDLTQGNLAFVLVGGAMGAIMYGFGIVLLSVANYYDGLKLKKA